MNKVRLIDMHSHILPKADHGCSSVSMSVNLVQKAKSCGVEAIAATPHFYHHRTTVSDFLDLRERCYDDLMNGLEKAGLGDFRIVKGAEVTIETELIGVSSEDLSKLCYENTDYILLEMPFVTWSDWVFKTIDAIKHKHGLKPIIAHIERYSDPMINELYDEMHIAQFNADIAARFFSRKEIIKLYNNDSVHIMGSDLHNDTTRNYDNFIKAGKKLPADMLEQLYANSMAVLNNKDLHY